MVIFSFESFGSQTNLACILIAFLMFTGLINQFPLLTMYIYIEVFF